MALTLGFERGPHWWEASALATAPPVETGFHLHYRVNSLSPKIHIQILQTDFNTFPSRISWENLFKDQIIFPEVIILFILMTFTLDDVLRL